MLVHPKWKKLPPLALKHFTILFKEMETYIFAKA